LVDAELPRILFLEDRSGFEEKRLATKIDQEPLNKSTQRQLETEIKMLPDLCKILDSVHTSRDFLVEAGGQPMSRLDLFLVSSFNHICLLYNVSRQNSTFIAVKRIWKVV
jgi:hypothetical protein